MRNQPKILQLALILLMFTQPAWAVEDLMTSHLVGQARHWQAKDRDDLAAEIWRSILRSDPAQGEALVKLGIIEARAGNHREATILLEQASRVSPKPRGLAELTAVLSAEASKTDSAVLSSVKSLGDKAEIQPKERKSRTKSTNKTSPATAPDPLLLKP